MKAALTSLFAFSALAPMLAACGDATAPGEVVRAQTSEGEFEPITGPYPTPGYEPVPDDARNAPNADFAAIAPSTLGVIAAPDLIDALGPLVNTEGDEGGEVYVSITLGDLAANADVLRDGLADDSVAATQTRVSFHFSTDDNLWRATGAERRFKCRRGPNADQWTKELCP